VQDWSWLKTQQEGQFFDRTSCIDRSGRCPKRRPAREVARDVAEALTAMANADGGMLVLGIEDDGTPTGVNYPPDRLDVIIRAPQRLVHPPLKAHYQWVDLDDVQILVFKVHRLKSGFSMIGWKFAVPESSSSR